MYTLAWGLLAGLPGAQSAAGLSGSHPFPVSSVLRLPPGTRPAPKNRVQSTLAFVRLLGTAWNIKEAFPALCLCAHKRCRARTPACETLPGQGPSDALCTGRHGLCSTTSPFIVTPSDPGDTQEQAILQIRRVRETEMENERQTTGEIKFLQKALKNPSTTHSENCVSPPIWSNNTAERK